MDCIFCKVIKKELPAKFVYEDNDIVVFPDIHPVRDIHLLIVPKKHVAEFIEVDDADLFKKLFIIVQKMVREQKLENKGYRVVINGGGAQLVHHLHVHIMGPVKNTAAL